MDADNNGTITLAELRSVLQEKFHVPDEETRQVFASLDSNSDTEIHYSDFLAAMVSTRIGLHDDLLRSTFKKFDTDDSGYITMDNLREVLGNGEQVKELIAEADQLKDGRISYPEFVAFLRREKLAEHAGVVIDKQLEVAGGRAGSKGELSLPAGYQAIETIGKRTSFEACILQ